MKKTLAVSLALTMGLLLFDAEDFPVKHVSAQGTLICLAHQANAVTIYPFIIYCGEEDLFRTRKHEMIHVRQIHQDGVVLFYLKYFSEYYSALNQGKDHMQAYNSISYEREAHKEKDSGSLD